MVTRLAKNRLLPQKPTAAAAPVAVAALVRLVSILAAQAAREFRTSSLAARDRTRSDTSATIPGSAAVSPEADDG